MFKLSGDCATDSILVSSLSDDALGPATVCDDSIVIPDGGSADDGHAHNPMTGQSRKDI